jgi:hypothetical protein
MIKWIKSLIKKIFKKTKTTSELLREGFDEEQKALELEERVEEPVVEKIQCNTHLRFKKSCPICVEAAK